LKRKHENKNCKIVNLKTLPKTFTEAQSIVDEVKEMTIDCDSKRIASAIVTQEELRKLLIIGLFISLHLTQRFQRHGWLSFSFPQELLTFKTISEERNWILSEGLR